MKTKAGQDLQAKPLTSDNAIPIVRDLERIFCDFRCLAIDSPTGTFDRVSADELSLQPKARALTRLRRRRRIVLERKIKPDANISSANAIAVDAAWKNRFKIVVICSDSRDAGVLR